MLDFKLKGGRAPNRAPVMPSRADILPRLALICDAASMLVVGLVAVVLRTQFGMFNGRLDRHTVLIAGPFMLVGWVAVIAVLGGYRERILGAGTEEYRIIARATLVAAGLVGVSAYLLQFQLSRSFFLIVFILGALTLVVTRAILRRGIHRARSRGALSHQVVIAGTPTHIDEIARVLSRESWLGYHVIGGLVPAGEVAEETIGGTPVLGTADRAQEVLTHVGADVIFMAGGALDGAGQMREMVWELEAHDVQVIVAPNVTDVARERIQVRPVAGLPLVHIDRPRHVLASRKAKRLFDLALTGVVILGAAPMLMMIALTIKLSDRGPVFFRQQRVGRDGTVFDCLKFRTMVVDAEERLAKLKAAQGFDGGLFKMKDDPRVTAAGKILRRFSLDELPQLLNVLRGDMSLVGPRPPLPSEVATYDRFTRRRLHVRPGMTGLWQVSGRSDLSWDESIRLDLYYVDNWSMVQDMNIIAKTFGAVFGSRGAY